MKNITDNTSNDRLYYLRVQALEEQERKTKEDLIKI
jgi:hypothetical protein